jgi:group II intron reverse transcriptase/maturase
MIFSEKQKTQPIDRLQVWNAFKRVRSNQGSAGVDGLTISEVSAKPVKYLYPLWNRLASGSYRPKPVRQTLISKGEGKMRALGIPTIIDRVAQQVIADELEELVDRHFSTNSFGYRPHKSAHDAIDQCRIHCMKYSWVIDLDIKGFFDNIDHGLLMKAVKHFTNKRHILLYVERWLKAPVQLPDGTLKYNQGKGTPQGGVISPVLANLFLHFVFDKWIEKQYPQAKFERYADDIVIHCQGIKPALRMMEAIKQRLTQCKLELNRKKSKIVYCRRNQKRQPPFKPRYQKFDFLGFTFKPRMVKDKGRTFLSVTPSISQKNTKRISEECYKLKLHRMVHLTLDKLATILEAKTKGWIYYYGKFRMSGLRRAFRVLNMRLAQWVRNKYRRFRRKHWYYAYKWLKETSKDFPNMFVHWKYGFRP